MIMRLIHDYLYMNIERFISIIYYENIYEASVVLKKFVKNYDIKIINLGVVYHRSIDIDDTYGQKIQMIIQ